MNNHTSHEARKVLVAGGTGYLGGYILKESVKRGYEVRAIVRQSSASKLQDREGFKVHVAEATDSNSLAGCCEGIGVVISTIGITRQRDGLTYMDVDFQANKYLLEEAKKSGVKKFIYISVLNGDKLQHVKLCEAKEAFVAELEDSGLDCCIVRPNGFFSDLTDFYHMALKGRVFLFGDGKLQLNPVHGADLAEVCVDMIESNEREIGVGGPETLTQTEIAEIAFQAAGLPAKITYIPDWVRRLVLKLAGAVMNKHAFGPMEFFLNVMGIEMKAPEYGTRTLLEYYRTLNE